MVLVLTLLGVLLLLAWKANELAGNLKESQLVEVVLKDVEKPLIDSFVQSLESGKVFKKIQFISADEAAKIMEKELGENFISILGYNPLYNSLHLFVKEQYADTVSLSIIKKNLLLNSIVSAVNYQVKTASQLHSFIQEAIQFCAIALVALLIFSIGLIFSTIKLFIYSKKESIKTMLLFGAKRWYISKPFLGRAILNGFIAGIIACAAIASLLFYLHYQNPALNLLAQWIPYAIIGGSLIVFGILISFLCTIIALKRYLNFRLEDL